MRNKTVVPVGTFKSMFRELIPWESLYALLSHCGVRRRCPPLISAWELMQGLVFHAVAGAGTPAEHVKELTSKTVTDGALSQRRALLPIAVFEQIMGTAGSGKSVPVTTPRNREWGTPLKKRPLPGRTTTPSSHEDMESSIPCRAFLTGNLSSGNN